jgi:paraquat-inducible protein A
MQTVRICLNQIFQVISQVKFKTERKSHLMPSHMTCHDCDLITHVPYVKVGKTVLCPRCGSLLAQPRTNSIEHSLALVITNLVLFTVAINFPFLAMQSSGFEQQSTLISGVWLLHNQGMNSLALVVLLTCLLFPLIQMAGLLYVLLPLHFKRRLPGSIKIFLWIQKLQPWSMMEVFMLGTLVSLVKLTKLAEIIPGISLWAFALLIFTTAAQSYLLDRHQVWNQLGHANV